MSETEVKTTIDRAFAQRQLAEAQRCAEEIVKIYETGAWKLHYSAAEFAELARQAKEVVDRLTALCG
jgi:hypothetical protein